METAGDTLLRDGMGDITWLETGLRHKELKGRRGKGPDGQAHTHEIKLAAIFTEHPRPGEDPWRDRDSTTYVATHERCGGFGPMVRAEFFRRFAGRPETIAIGDGAAWIWRLFWINFPWAIQIVDFHHAAEHVASLAELVHPRDSRLWKKLCRNWTAKLWNGRIDALLASAHADIPHAKARKGRKALVYFITHRTRMRYDIFRAKGYFIGSRAGVGMLIFVVGYESEDRWPRGRFARRSRCLTGL